MKFKNYFSVLIFISPLFLLSQNAQTIRISNSEILDLYNDQLFFADALPEKDVNTRFGHFQRHPRNMLGAPKIIKGAGWPNNKVTSLGCRGQATVMFKAKGLVDGPGPDLLIFEEGKYMEATTIEISTDGIKWIPIGMVKGGKSTIDIANEDTKGKVFHYVKFKDMGTRCDRVPNDGADINAVAALHTKDLLEEKEIVSPIVDKSNESSRLRENQPNETPSINMDFTIYPNPTNNELNLKFDLEKESEISVRLFDQQGKLVKTILYKETKTAGSQIVFYSLGDLAAGTYYIQLLIDDQSAVKKLIKHMH